MTPNRLSTVLGFTVALAFGAAGTACDRGASPLAPAGATLSQSSDATSAQTPPIDVGGTWHYREDAVLVFSGELAALLGLASEGPTLRLHCSSPDGVLTLVQTGSTFTGTLEHPTGTCRTQSGQIAPTPWALPYRATLSGRVTGRALHFDQVDNPPDPAGPVTCPKNGTIQVVGGVAVQLETVGRCDLSVLPVRPAMATNSATGTRQ